jgi:hypothetical protein
MGIANRRAGEDTRSAGAMQTSSAGVDVTGGEMRVQRQLGPVYRSAGPIVRRRALFFESG